MSKTVKNILAYHCTSRDRPSIYYEEPNSNKESIENSNDVENIEFINNTNNGRVICSIQDGKNNCYCSEGYEGRFCTQCNILIFKRKISYTVLLLC